MTDAQKLTDECREGSIAAIDKWALWLDDRMYAGEFDRIEALLDGLDPRLVPPEVSTMVLAMTKPVISQVNKGRKKLLGSLQSALIISWDVDESLAQSTVARLK